VRQRSGSLFPAMLCHAAFNLGMAACLFLEVWPRLPK
jgi:membrane protease YdiL (CAAX protease family)